MDTFTQRYIKGLAVIALIVAIINLSQCNPLKAQINDALVGDPELAQYPYHFHVVDINDSHVVLSSPRSAQSSAVVALRIMYPELRDAGVNSDALQAAQTQLAKTQAKAAKIATQQGAASVSWKLDETWLRNNGVTVLP